MKKLMLLVVASVVGFSSMPARATTLDITLGLSGTDLGYSLGGTVVPNEQFVANPNLVLNQNSLVVAPANSVPDLFTAPSGPIYGDSYLAVLGVNGTGIATYNLTANQHVLGFTWGTIDDYNSLVITDSRNVQYTITGAEVLANIAGSVAGQTQSDVLFSDAFGSIKSVEFESTGNSFEVANLENGSAVPLPPALPLFGAAFLGLMLLGRRKTTRRA